MLPPRPTAASTPPRPLRLPGLPRPLRPLRLPRPQWLVWRENVEATWRANVEATWRANVEATWNSFEASLLQQSQKKLLLGIDTYIQMEDSQFCQGWMVTPAGRKQKYVRSKAEFIKLRKGGWKRISRATRAFGGLAEKVFRTVPDAIAHQGTKRAYEQCQELRADVRRPTGWYSDQIVFRTPLRGVTAPRADRNDIDAIARLIERTIGNEGERLLVGRVETADFGTYAVFRAEMSRRVDNSYVLAGKVMRALAAHFTAEFKRHGLDVRVDKPRYFGGAYRFCSADLVDAGARNRHYQQLMATLRMVVKGVPDYPNPYTDRPDR